MNKTSRTGPKLNSLIRHPLLERAGLIAESYDPEWGLVLRKAARGSFLPDFSILGTNVIYIEKKKGKKNNITFDISPIDDCETAPECIDNLILFFRTYSTFYSSQDTVSRKELAETIRDENSVLELTWKSASERDRINLISKYVESQGLRYRLTAEERTLYFNTIYRKYKESLINASNVVLGNKAILEIKGEFWDEETRCFYFDSSFAIPSKSSAKVKPKTTDESKDQAFRIFDIFGEFISDMKSLENPTSSTTFECDR